MEQKDINFLEQLLYSDDKTFVVHQLSSIKNPILLHCFALNYNWNNGFDIPKMILSHSNCDLGTGLLLFYQADGYRMLVDSDEVLHSSSEDWKDFLKKTYNQVINLEFETQDISFEPELTKIQMYKLKKNNPKIPDVFVNKSPGKMVDIPKI
jgi:hypothetical protein